MTMHSSDYEFKWLKLSWLDLPSQEKFDYIYSLIQDGKNQLKDGKANVYLGSEVAKFIKQHLKTLKHPVHWVNDVYIDEDVYRNCIIVRSGIKAIAML